MRAAGEREAEDIRTVALNESDSMRRTAEGDAAEIRRTADTGRGGLDDARRCGSIDLHPENPE